jgi:hypothetical protein
MAAKLDVQTLGLVFESRPDILAGIRKAAGMHYLPMFEFCLEVAERAWEKG